MGAGSAANMAAMRFAARAVMVTGLVSLVMGFPGRHNCALSLM
jgi:hypothetical protein